MSKAMVSSRETDVAVVGYGGAGAAAAITAADLGAKVLIVEKAAAGGGNTRLSSGSVRTFGAVERAVEHITFLCGGATDPDVIETLVRESHDNEPWLRSLGGDVVVDPLQAAPASYPVYPTGAASPEQPGADGVGPRLRVKGDTTANGRDLWELLDRNVDERCIPVLFQCPAVRLLRDSHGAVTGLTARRGGEEIVIQARKAVILACGGYERDPDMQLQFLGQRFWSLGASGHTGDGIRLALDAGASLWHMNAVAAGFGYRVDGFDGAVIHAMPGPGFIYVDRNARRFVDETAMDAHAVGSLVTELDLETMERPRVPCYVVFDEATRAAGPVANTGRGAVAEHYRWSDDNAAEVGKGWIKQGENPAALAAALDLNPAALERTVDEYNKACAGGRDEALGRSPDTLRPLAHPPFYGAALWPSLFNTQGGPRRNARAQVLNAWGRPIQGLYSAGELGSMWSQNYPGASNLTEVLAFGRIAGRNAAGEE
ncbi:MAG: FAD-binding protein [Deltaproteobacteria bacterium]|nr:FAD-binding protein [Deltaproteobacteria bacterium]